MSQNRLLAVFTLAIVLLTAEALALESSRWRPSLSPAERARIVSLQLIAAAYLFALGATLGSFLNVVIYRAPRGMNIVRPRSRCPACGTPIEMRDNIPVLGWLLLRGRCRTCGGPISPRYPLVEAAVGGILVVLFWLEVRLGGVNLPLREPTPLDELMLFSWRMPWGNFLQAAYHSWLLITLLVMVLIQWDRQRVPRMIVWLALFVGLVLPLAWPWLRPVPAIGATSVRVDRTWWHAGVDGLIGSSMGMLIGRLLGWSLPEQHRPREARRSLTAALTLIGSFLGWQAALSIGMFSAAMQLMTGIVARDPPRLSRLPPLTWAALGCGLHVLFWKDVMRILGDFERLAESPWN